MYLAFFYAVVKKLPVTVSESLIIKKYSMGRGDKKTKKGKIFKGSFGKTRPSKATKKTPEKKEA